MPTTRDGRRVSTLDVVAFLTELLLMTALAVGGARLPVATPLRVLLAIALPVVAVAIWASLLAPRLPRRLTGLVGFAVKAVLFSGAAVLLGVTTSWLWAGAFWCVSIAIWAVIGWRERGAARL